MIIYSVFDKEFAPYGRVHTGYDTRRLMDAMEKVPMPESGVSYKTSIGTLEECGLKDQLSLEGYGGMPIQIGMCWGYNTLLNCLEYHRDSEFNCGSTDFVLLLAKQEDIVDGVVDSSVVKAFSAPKGAMVEVYATSLHYAPCRADENGFRVAVVLPQGTNEEKPAYTPHNEEASWMTARNKWLLAHRDTPEAKSGAHIGIAGINLDITKD
ncbi:MAG: DUF4867 family protein [Spirochaetales bacterium]|nr:DUF4867 family protein [Candidatus Physcosoma equi]